MSAHAHPGGQLAGLLRAAMQGQGPEPVQLFLLFPHSTRPSLCPFLNGKLEAWPPEGMRGGRERTLLIPTSTADRKLTPGDSGGSCFRPSAATLGVAWQELSALEPFRANVCPSQMRHSCSLSLGTCCWTWVLPSVRLGLILPAGQCGLLVPSTKLDESGRGFQQPDQVTNEVVSPSHVSTDSWLGQESSLKHREVGTLRGCHLPEGSCGGCPDRSWRSPCFPSLCIAENSGQEHKKEAETKCHQYRGPFLRRL